jgi:hypothetical protein
VPRLVVRVCILTSALVAVAATARAQDSYPQGAISFFNSSSCPTGWSPAVSQDQKLLDGFFLVPFTPPVPAGLLTTTVGTAMSSGEVRTHSHGYTASITLPQVKYVGEHASGNEDPSEEGTYTFSGTTSANGIGLSYVQLLVCLKTAFQRNESVPTGVPASVMMFFATAVCPTGWKPASNAGRFVVGNVSGTQSGTPIGTTPLSLQEDRQHTHTFSGTVTLPYARVALLSGGGADHYGKTGTYQFSGTTAPAAAGLPYVIVTQCQPCVDGDPNPTCQAPPVVSQ